MYDDLMKVLSHLNQDRQKVITDLSRFRAKQFCDRYDNHTEEFEEVAYCYELSKFVRTSIYKEVMFGVANVQDFMAIHQIKTYFTEKLDFLLNTYIDSRSAGNGSLQSPPHEVVV